MGAGEERLRPESWQLFAPCFFFSSSFHLFLFFFTPSNVTSPTLTQTPKHANYGSGRNGAGVCSLRFSFPLFFIILSLIFTPSSIPFYPHFSVFLPVKMLHSPSNWTFRNDAERELRYGVRSLPHRSFDMVAGSVGPEQLLRGSVGRVRYQKWDRNGIYRVGTVGE